MSETEKKRIYLDLFESSPVKSDYSDPMGLVYRAEEDIEFAEPDELPDSKWQLAANMLLQGEAIHFARCYLASEDGRGLSYEEIKSRCEGFWCLASIRRIGIYASTAGSRSGEVAWLPSRPERRKSYASRT